MTYSSLHQRVVQEARRWIGTPYVHQASANGHGADCLGLIRGVWRGLYGTEPQALPAYTGDWAEVSGEETMIAAGKRWFDTIPLEAMRAGDVVIFRWRDGMPAKHAGILTGKSSFIHAYERAGVVEVRLAKVWRSRIVAAFRFPVSPNLPKVGF